MADREHLVPAEDQQRYLEVLEDVVSRLLAVKAYAKNEPAQPTVEYCALQMRMVLEQIVMGSLVTNRTHVEAISKAFREKKKAGDIRKLVKNVNPDYWPKAMVVHDLGEGAFEMTPVEGVLTEDRWGPEWGALSEPLHARNPFMPPLDLPTAHREAQRVADEITKLLAHHVITLAGTDYMLIGQIDENEVSLIAAARDAQMQAQIGPT